MRSYFECSLDPMCLYQPESARPGLATTKQGEKGKCASRRTKNSFVTFYRRSYDLTVLFTGPNRRQPTFSLSHTGTYSRPVQRLTAGLSATLC